MADMSDPPGHRELVGTKEAAGLYGVRTQNFVRDWASRPDFPAPLATLAATRVWDRQEVEAYRDATRGITWPPRRPGLQLSAEATRWLPVIKRRLVRDFHPDRIILFGSQARGEGRPDSDLDLLVILPQVDDARATRSAIHKRLLDVPIPRDVVVTTPAKVERYGDLVGTILRPALREGVTIYARG
jgi:predicted nucleotidyltransferase